MGPGIAVTPSERPLAAMVGIALALTSTLTAPAPVGAQEQRRVSFTPGAESPVERRLARFIDAGDYRLWESDTTLSRGDTVRSDVLVLESMVRLEGRVEGDLVAVDSDVFLRPHATVAGDLVVLGGGMYRSSLASVEGEVVYEPNRLLQAVPSEGGWEIHPAAARRNPLELDGLSGLRLPSVQRVDGWTFSAGGRLQAVDLAWQPSLHLSGGFRTGGERITGSARQYWYPSGRLRVGLEGGRATRSTDRWIRADAANTLTFLFGGEDYRNYHESDRVLLGSRYDFGGGETLGLTAGWERVRSLPARGAGGLFGDETVDPNPAVDPGDAWRASLAAEIGREAGGDSLNVDLRVEGADESLAGDFSYLFAEAVVEWNLPAAANHRLHVEGRARGDLAGDLPRHRWSAIGGAGTLPTLDLLELRGPRLLFGRATYVIPFPVLRVPALGGPELLLRAAAGTAWEDAVDPALHENLVAGLRFLVFEGGIAWNPGAAAGEETRGFFTVTIPR